MIHNNIQIFNFGFFIFVFMKYILRWFLRIRLSVMKEYFCYIRLVETAVPCLCPVSRLIFGVFTKAWWDDKMVRQNDLCRVYMPLQRIPVLNSALRGALIRFEWYSEYNILIRQRTEYLYIEDLDNRTVQIMQFNSYGFILFFFTRHSITLFFCQ